jgi:hypothetical protein
MARSYFTMIFLLSVAHVCKGEIVTLAPVTDGEWRSVTETGVVTVNTSLTSLKAERAERGINISSPDFGIVSQFAMEFPLSTLHGLTVTSATLSWTEIRDEVVNAQRHPIFASAGDGVIDANDFSSLPVSISVVSNGVEDPVYSLDVTSTIDALVQANSDFVAFVVGNAGATTSLPVFQTQWRHTVLPLEIHSRLAANPEVRPMLIIQSVPETSSASLLLALFVLAPLFIGRRQVRRRCQSRRVG